MQFMEVPHTKRRYYLLRYKKLCSIITTGALIASTGAAAFGADYKTSIKLVLSSGKALEHVYDEAYTLAIPEALTITQEGWNSIGNMTASYGGTNDGFDPEKKLVVTAASTTGFKLTASGISDTIGYTVRTSASDSEATTTFEFTAAEITKAGTSKPIGVHVDSFSGKSNATYTDTITYTAVVEDAITWHEIDISMVNTYAMEDGDLLTGTAGSDAHITVEDGATIKLKDATITSIPNDGSYSWAGITCAGDATIILEGTNTVKGGYRNYPGIHIAQNATLTIKGSGSLTASSNGYGAGIGGGYETACGNIVIEGGNITATGGRYAAGIGSGIRASCGNITISGGTVNSAGGQNAAGIGSGSSASCGNITISGGNITATGGTNSAGIGSGYNASCGDITITDGVTSVTATKGDNAPNSIGAGDSGTCGTVTIAEGAKAKVTQN